MKLRSTHLSLRPSLCIALAFCIPFALFASDATDRAHGFEHTGNAVAAREALATVLKSTPDDGEALTSLAELLERYKDPGAREAWRKASAGWKKTGRAAEALAAARRAVLLDLIAGDRTAATADLASYQALGGNDLQLPLEPTRTEKFETVQIPGPLRSFARMAAIAPDVQPDEVLPALARNIVTNGYKASRANDELEETEYLKLVKRYLAEARELDKLAGAEHMLKVASCESTQTNDLLRVLGFRIRGACGSELILETVNAQRAFISTDSGFPIAELEQALRTDKPFQYDYRSSGVSVLYAAAYWLSPKEKAAVDFIDAFLSDPGLCRFYLGMSKLDPETANTLRENSTPVKLRAFANVLDFFGGNFEIRQGKAVVPGGARSIGIWTELAGVSPDKGSEFFERLMMRDDGWLASLYDSLARIHGPLQDYLTDPSRMKRLYSAIRGKVTTPGPARPVFRSNTEMMLLTTRLHLDADGRIHIPGDLELWKDLFQRNPKGKYDAKLSKAASGWKDADDVVEALFALCRKPVDNEPLKIFMGLSDLDRNRAQPLKPETVRRMVTGWTTFGAQFSVLNDAPSVSDKTISAWLDAMELTDKTRDTLFRQDVIGMFQGLTGLWQIFCRQGSIPAAKADEALAGLVAPFASIRNNRDLFDAGRSGLQLLAKSTGGATPATNLQERLLGLLAGGPALDNSEARAELVLQEQRIFEAQKLLSIDLLFELADNLEAVTKGGKLNPQLASRLATRVADIQLPRNSMTGAEKNAQAFGFYVDKHVDEERKLNLRAMIDKASKDPEKLKDVRGQLAPTLRDSIIGMSYVHYAPPGAQILMTNPLFVRGHDFIGMTGANHSWRTTEMYGTGWPANAGGRLVGSLAGLPYALAEAEQNFLVPSQTQALIWGDLVPQMLLSARTSRFWTVTPAQMHWVGLHMRYAESAIAEAALNPRTRDELSIATNRVASPYRAAMVMRAVTGGDAHRAIDLLTPAETYLIATALTTRLPGASPETSEIAHLRALYPNQVDDASISRVWGTPKPTLANSWRPELLNLRTFPTLMGYSSRIMAESWESNQLYWADMGDQMGVPPAQLNLLVPDWTRKVVERIFASHLEDWPALLKSLRSVGEEIRVQGTAVEAGN